MSRSIIVAIVASLALLSGCGLDIPSVPDGRGRIVVTVADTSGFLPGSILGNDSISTAPR